MAKMIEYIRAENNVRCQKGQELAWEKCADWRVVQVLADVGCA